MTAQLLTMQDIANLAQVSRPAVSQWRRRDTIRGAHVPFPSPVSRHSGVERFAYDDVTAWLRKTERGNNPEFAEDAPSLALPEPAIAEATALVLLALRTAAPDDLVNLPPDALVTLAVELDPEDSFLFSEALDAEFTPEELQFVDGLYSASYGSNDALARLDAGRIARNQGKRGFTDDLMDALCAVIDASGSPVTVSVDSPDFLPITRAKMCAGLQMKAADSETEATDTTQERLTRLRAHITGIPLATPDSDPCCAIMSVHGLPRESVFSAIDDLALNLTDQDRAIVIGPADMLCERPENRATAEDRAVALRATHSSNSGRLAAALRLPRGWWKESVNQAMGLWLLDGTGGIKHPYVADLVDQRIDLTELQNDLAAVLHLIHPADAGTAQSSGRSFKYLQGYSAADIFSGHPVVPAGAIAERFGLETTTHIDQVQAATVLTASTSAPCLDVAVQPAPGHMRLPTVPLGQLLGFHDTKGGKRQTQIKRINGSRIDPRDSDSNGTVPVRSAGSETPLFYLDPIDATKAYPQAAHTEPGDVVFTCNPPAAHVDETGGSIVMSPSRILRVHKDPPAEPEVDAAGQIVEHRPQKRTVGPHALADQINRQTGTEHLAWQISLIPTDQAEALESALRDAQAYRTELNQRLAAASSLSEHLIAGISDGTLNIVDRSGWVGAEEQEGTN
ncbi:helix-turn-helix domain-containing protein [Brevibacterium sp. 91QC2O2]|uniref:helix-turn-helix transcriptional regulator n=1 Tax=Brevibacterium TaxID=1696 RepID=UPI00211C18DB|nr:MULTISPECIES: helix-turn-helix domain-containing protein [unclassified Brevibacterium]MCQ9367136.1 helix-turn-helix domain-containing protein [Brevibacterium sp. 91QC2O2]MCQ9385417.1 helix-turn-helix domain-containing protein [Brevibacterium sp. 68QC2CO]